ncbi:hypothetical protein BgAZ_302620 [Babesia gibsoni]|uniref:Uncharacterized protein n=1 Tax=Babesia gibsoni TaxID=33632 RepID=A0AAD8PDG2_BABGI|nr:hypothetical protein BgAZ_302620 [Babesia gibsoni]
MFTRRLLFLIWSLITLGSREIRTYEPEYELSSDELVDGPTVRILKFGNPGGRSVSKGDKVRALIRSFSPSVKADISGFAEQQFVAGDYPVTPLNDAILNMQLDEIRRIGISFGNYGKIFYEVHVIAIH